MSERVIKMSKSVSSSDATPLQRVMNYNYQLKQQNSNSILKSNNIPRSKSPIYHLKNLTEGDLTLAAGCGSVDSNSDRPFEFYKMRCGLLTEQISLVQDENDKLTKQCSHLRTLNFEYVKQLNEISSSKIRAAEKIIITPEFFESDLIQQKVKDFMRKLANNYKLLEKEQVKLIDHCRIMEVDIENYRNKVIEADVITEKLKITGQSSIDSLVQSLKDSNKKVDELTHENKELSFQFALKIEQISALEGNIDDFKAEISDHIDEHSKITAKFNNTINANEEKKNVDHQIMYTMQCKCDYLEHELRLMHGSLQHSGEEIQHLDLYNLNILYSPSSSAQHVYISKIKELNDSNESLSRLSQSTFTHSRRNLSGTSPIVTFK